MTAFAAGGGAYHAIVGTLLQGVVCAVISIPVGVFVGIYLVEYGGGTRLGKLTTFMVDILTGVPSIVAALFIYALWVATLGFQRSGFAVSLALVLLMIPVIVRSTEEMLRIVPMDLREASYALGVPKWKTIARIVIPTALSGIVTGIMLALARVMGETAPLLILVGYAAGDELRHVQRVHGLAARHDVRPDFGRRRRQSGAHRPAVGRGADPDRADRGPQHRRAFHRQILCPQEGLGASSHGQASRSQGRQHLLRSFHAVADVALSVPPRSVTAFIGPSGCGKSTVLRTLNRMHEVIPGARVEGSVLLDGEDIYGAGVDPVGVRKTIGMVFQRPNPFPTMSIRDNVVAGLKLQGVRNKKSLDEVAERSLKGANLWNEVKDRLDKPGGGLSGGQQQRLCIARAIAVQPDVLLMDEPCSALDPISTLAIEDLIAELKQDFTIVIVTHNMQQAESAIGGPRPARPWRRSNPMT